MVHHITREQLQKAISNPLPPAPWRVVYDAAGVHIRSENADWYLGPTFDARLAQLIAAAPELLEALYQILRLDEINEWDAVERVLPEIQRLAREAIAKAAGNTNAHD